MNFMETYINQNVRFRKVKRRQIYQQSGERAKNSHFLFEKGGKRLYIPIQKCNIFATYMVKIGR